MAIRRSSGANSSRAAKPGDLTEELRKRRGEPPVNSAPEIEVADFAMDAGGEVAVSDAETSHASSGPAENAIPRSADANAYVDADADDVPDYIVKDPPTATVPADLQQPAPLPLRQPGPGDLPAVAENGAETPSGTSVTGATLRKRMMGQQEDRQDEAPLAEATPDGLPPAEWTNSEESGPGGPEAEQTPTSPENGAVEAQWAEAQAKGRLRLSKKQERETVLRSRMAAVLEKETRRREEWEARKTERGDEPPSAAPPPQRPATPQYDDIFRYWSSERRGRPLPALSSLDQDVIARQWPDTLLLRYTARTNYLELSRNFAKSGEVGDITNAAAGKIDFTPSVVEWVVSQGRAAAYEENPVRATEELDTRWGTAHYKVVALPLAEDGQAIDHILCHLEPA